MSAPIAESDFRPLHLDVPGGRPVLIAWCCPTCAAMIPHITDLPAGSTGRPIDEHIAWHEEIDR